MSTLEAMSEVMSYLNAGDYAMAQCAVMSFERNGSCLPSSMFERVLRASISADQLLPLYADWCKRAYGVKNSNSILFAK